MTDAEQGRLGTDTVLWTASAASSLDTNLDPRLTALGDVPRRNVELVRLAAAVYAADRTTPRTFGGSNWNQRDFVVRVPVWEPDGWKTIADPLTALLNMLSGDRWLLEFYRSRPPRSDAKPVKLEPVVRVVLLSGGADSLCGALISRLDLKDRSQALLSHVSWRNLSPVQRALAASAEALAPNTRMRHHQLRLGLRSRQPRSRVAFLSEPSSRTRSLLFLSLGLAAAAPWGAELWVPENGFASLNPPLAPERRGALSTRTTHPAFLGGLAELIAPIGVHADLRNPFQDRTKGEMFAGLASRLGRTVAGQLLSSSHSCGHTGARAHGLPATAQCGVCFGCLLRRSAFVASGIDDGTRYLCEEPISSARDAYLSGKTAVAALRYFVERGHHSPGSMTSIPSGSHRRHPAGQHVAHETASDARPTARPERGTERAPAAVGGWLEACSSVPPKFERSQIHIDLRWRPSAARGKPPGR